MVDKIISLCGQEQTLSLLRWILRTFEKGIEIRQYDTQEKLREALDSAKPDILILDAEVVTKSLFDYLKGLRKKNADLNTVVIVYPNRKNDILKIIRAGLVKGVIVRPFSGEVVCKYVDRLL